MKLALVTATAILATASMASAESRVSTSFSKLDVDGGGYTEGLTLEMEGYESNFDYELSVTDGEVNGAQAQSVYGKAGWTGLGLGQVKAGPVFSYSGSEVGGAGWNDQTAAGAMVRGDFDRLTVVADVLSDTDNFGDDWMGGVEATYAATDRMDIFGEYDYIDVADSHAVEIGARYNFASNMYVEGAGIYQDVSGTSAKGARLGIGVSF